MATKARKTTKTHKGITYRADKNLYMWRFTHNGTSYCGYCKELDEAIQQLKTKRYEIENGICSKEANVTLDCWFKTWIATYKHNCKDSSKKTYTHNYNSIISPKLGKLKIKNISVERLQLFVNQTADTYSKSTAQSCIQLLDQCFERARKNKLINKNPMNDIETPKFKDTELKRALSAEQERMFFDYPRTKKSKYYAIYRTLALTGMRIGETLALTWDCVDFENESIWIKQNLCYTPKNGLYFDTPKSKTSRRRLRMKKDGELYNLLKKRRIEQFNERTKASNLWQPMAGFENLVFCTTFGKPHYDDNIRGNMRSIISKMQKDGYDIPTFTPHTFRHCFATRWIEQGGGYKELQKALGHSTFAITMDLYADVMDSSIDSEWDKIAFAL